FSEEAIARAKATYGHLPDLTFIKGDAFHLPPSMDQAFDIVFEHTLYCAISPDRRNELVRAWRRALVETGHVMGVFFAFDKPAGPPFGGSEWEIRARLLKTFRSLYWQRLKNSTEARLGIELFVYAQKRSAL
ncbi:MAG: class I SAM-dependent methyltransferase, partial [Bdellovibrionota bacterium]